MNHLYIEKLGIYTYLQSVIPGVEGKGGSVEYLD